MCLIASNICWVRYLINTVINFHSRLDEQQLPSFTATDNVTELVNTEHVGNRQQDAMLPS